MLDLAFIRANPDTVRVAVTDKNIALDIDTLLQADRRVTELRHAVQTLEEQRNVNARAVRSVGVDQRDELIAKGKAIAQDLDRLKPEIRQAEAALQDYLWLTPAIPSPDAPVGRDDAENVELRRQGTLPHFDFPPRDHVELLRLNDWGDLDRAAAIGGSRSYALKNELALLEMTLHRFAMDTLQQNGFTPVSVPALAREAAFYGTGHFPTAQEETYRLADDDLYLAGTAEIVVNSLHGGEILNEADLPVRYAAISPCFRREAGSSGKDTRGLIRVHQFTKVEQYVLCRNDPAESHAWFDRILALSEGILTALELPYRVLDVCTGDMGTGKVRMHDLEAWFPSQDRYRETHSCSMLHDWQARRTDLRYRDSSGAVRYCHTLNNTGIATPRILVPLLEVHQQADGNVRIPEALRAYMGGAEMLNGRR